MFKRFLLTTLFAIFLPLQVRSIAGTELIAGAIVYKILSTQVVRTMGAVMAGYFLNSSAGREFSGKIKDFAVKKIFSNHEANNFRLISNSDLSSYFYSSSFIENKFDSIDKFSKTTNIQAAAQKLKAIESFSRATSKISLFCTKAKNVGADFLNAEKVQMLKNGKHSRFCQEENKTTGQFMGQQVKGFCPKIENNFYSDSYWKGFAQGSFASWLSVWLLSSNKKEKELQHHQKPIVMYVAAADLIRDELFKQGEVSLTESDTKMS